MEGQNAWGARSRRHVEGFTQSILSSDIQRLRVQGLIPARSTSKSWKWCNAVWAYRYRRRYGKVSNTEDAHIRISY
jgi:hypothetical protein